jgi:alkylated DNA repair dioxygenase AlkB
MISGLRYVPGYLDAESHDALLAAVDEGKWRAFGERRAQIYGYSYHYTKGGIYRVEDLPPWAQDLAARLERDGLMPALADQLIVSDYAAGQGIPAHVDAPIFTDTVISISLGSSCMMEFTHETGRSERQFLEPMSALVISGEARQEWKHAIPARKSDEWRGREWPRSRRVSLTFRTMLPTEQRPVWSPTGNRLPATPSSE